MIIIAAVGENGVIGNKGKLPWKNKDDLNHFKKTTLNNTVIMGRKTFESLPFILPNRKNIVISSTLKRNDVLVVNSLSEALKHVEGEAFVIGGAQLYSSALPLAKRLIISHMEGNFEGDVFFPDIAGWKTIKEEKMNGFTVRTYERY